MKGGGAGDLGVPRGVGVRAAGWLPAVILPVAAADQLWTALSADEVSGISVTAWGLFFFANLGSLAFAHAQTSEARLQVWIAFGTTALIDLAIVAAVLLRAT